MTKWSILLVLAVFLALLVVAARSEPVDITFAWDSNTETDLAGYNLYQSQLEGVYTFGPGCEVAKIPISAIPSTSCVLPSVEVDNTYYWVLTAYDKWGNESGPSNEVSNDKTAPAAPGGLSCK